MSTTDISEPATGERTSLIGRTLQILEVFEDEQPLVLGEIVRRTGLPKATAFRLVMSLVEVGYIERAHRGFRLGRKVHALGLVGSPYRPLVTLMRPHTERLFELVREPVTLQILDDNNVVRYIDTVRDMRCSMPSFRLGGAFGFRKNPHATAGGKVLLANSSSARLEALLAEELEGLTRRTITDPTVLREHLKLARERGYALSLGESRDGWISLAAPVFNGDGECMAAISVVGTMQMNVKTVLPLVDAAAKSATRALALEAASGG